MSRRKLYIFTPQKNPFLNILVILVLIVAGVFFSFYFSNNNFKFDADLENERNEIDPRRTIRINYENLNFLETNNNMNNLKIYFLDDRFLHVRNEKNLEYKTLDIHAPSIKDLSVFGNKSIYLTKDGNVFSSNEEFNTKTPLLLKRDEGPNNLSNKFYKYGDGIVVFDNGKLYSYNTKFNFWENLSSKFNFPKFEKTYFLKKFIIAIENTKLYLIYPEQDFSYKIENYEYKLKNITYNENNIFVLDEMMNIYKLVVDTEMNEIALSEKIFSLTSFEGNQILGVRYFNDSIWVVSDKAINRYIVKEKKWLTIKLPENFVDFYFGKNLFFIGKNKIYVYDISSQTFKLLKAFDYDYYYFFDGNDLFYYKNGYIYSFYENKTFKVDTNGFERFNANEINDAYFIDNVICFVSDNAIYTYNFKNKEYYSLFLNFKNLTFYNNKLLYLVNNKLYEFNPVENSAKEIKDNVLDFDIYNGKIAIVQSNGSISYNDKEYFIGDLDFDTSNLVELQTFENKILLVNKKSALVYDFENNKANKILDFNGTFKLSKRYDKNSFSIITDKYVYFFTDSSYVNSWKIKGNLYNTRGDYLIFIEQNSDSKIYHFLDKKGQEFIHEDLVINPKEIKDYFAFNNKIIFQTIRGEIYTFDIKQLKFNKLQLKYEGDLYNIQFNNNKVYVLMNNSLHDFFENKIIEKDVKDYTFWNDTLIILKSNGELILKDKKMFVGEIPFKILNSQVLCTSLYKNRFYYIITKLGIVILDLENINIKYENINIDNATFISENTAWVVCKNKLYKFTFNEERINKQNIRDFTNNYSLANKVYYKLNGKIMAIDENNNESVIHDFNTETILAKVKYVYYMDNYLYAFGSNFYAIYDVNNLKWEKIVKNIQVNYTYTTDSKIYASINDEKGYFNGLLFVKSNLPIGYLNSYNGYFESLNVNLNDIKAISLINDYVLIVLKDKILYFSLKLKSWKEFSKLENYVSSFNEDDGIIVFEKDNILKIYFDGEKLNKKSLRISYSDFHYSDFIVLRNDNNYTILNKDLTVIDKVTISKAPVENNRELIDLYYIYNNLYLIFNDNSLVYLKNNGTYSSVYKPLEKYLYYKNNLYVLIGNKLYLAYKDGLKLIDSNVWKFNVMNDYIVVLDKNQNLKTFKLKKEEVILEKHINIKGSIFNFNNKLFIFDKNSISVYSKTALSLIYNEDFNDTIISHKIISDLIFKDNYLTIFTNDKLFIYKISNTQVNKVLEINRLSKETNKKINEENIYIANGKIFIVRNPGNILSFDLNYDESDKRRVVFDMNFLNNIDFAFKYNNEFYFKTYDGKIYKLSKSLEIVEETTLKEVEKYKAGNLYILQVDNNIIFENSLTKTGKKFGNSYFLINDQIFVSEGKKINYSKINFYSNFAILDENYVVFENKVYEYKNFMDNLKFIKIDNNKYHIDDLKALYDKDLNKILLKKASDTILEINLKNKSKILDIINAKKGLAEKAKNIFSKIFVKLNNIFSKILKKSNTNSNSLDSKILIEILLLNQEELTNDHFYIRANYYDNVIEINNNNQNFEKLYEKFNYELAGSDYVIFNDLTCFDFKEKQFKNLSTILGKAETINKVQKGGLLINTFKNIEYYYNLEPGIYYAKYDHEKELLKVQDNNLYLWNNKEYLKISESDIYISLDNKIDIIPKIEIARKILNMDSVKAINAFVTYYENKLYYYLYIENYGFIIKDQNRYKSRLISFKERIDKIMTDSLDNVIIKDYNNNYYIVNNNKLIKKKKEEIIVNDQEIYFDVKLKIKNITRRISSPKAVYFFEKKLSISDIFQKGLFIFEIPDYYTFNGENLVFKKFNYIFVYNSVDSLKFLDNGKVEIPGYINKKLVDLRNNINKDYSVNIDLVNSKLSKVYNTKKYIYVNDQKINTTITENILFGYLYKAKLYLVTDYHIYEYSTNGLKTKYTSNSKIISSKMFIDSIYIKTKNNHEILYNLNSNTFKNYEGEKVSIDLIQKRMTLDKYQIKLFENFYDYSNINPANELYGLFNVKNAVKINNDLIVLTKNNFILKLHKNAEIFDVKYIGYIVNANNLQVINNKLIINNEYILANDKISKIDKKELSELRNIYDIHYNGNKIERKLSDNEKIEILYLENITNYKKIITNTIEGILEHNNILYLIGNNGIFKLTEDGIGLAKELKLENYNKVLNTVIINNNYMLKLNDTNLDFQFNVNQLERAVKIDEKSNIHNILSKKQDIFIENAKKVLSVGLNILNYDIIRNSSNYLYILKPQSDFKKFVVLNKEYAKIYKHDTKIANIFTYNGNITFESNNRDYNISDEKIQEINSEEFIHYSIDLLEKVQKKSNKPILLINGKTINKLSELLAKNVIFDDKGNVYFSNKFGVFNLKLKEKLFDKPILMKKRIGKVIYFTLENKEKHGFNFNEKVYYPYSQLLIDSKRNENTIGETKKFSYFGFSLDEIIKNGKFDFDNFRGIFTVKDNHLYSTTELGTWKFEKIAKFVSNKSLKDSKIVVDNGRESIVPLTIDDIERISSKKTNISINNEFEIKLSIKDNPKTFFITLNGTKKIFKNNSFVFDIPEDIYYDDKNLWFINNNGIFSNTKLIFNVNAKSKFFGETNYLLINNKAYKIENKELKEIKELKMKFSDNKWNWITTINNYRFENIYDKNLKRIYEKGFFNDDIIIDVFRDDKYFYLKTADNKLILINDENKIVNMKQYEGEKLKDYENSNLIEFQSENYIYKFEKGKNYLKVIKRKGSEQSE